MPQNKTFGDRVKTHLAHYKANAGILSHGVWKRSGRPYPHILPEEHFPLNILAPYREDFWKRFTGLVKLHEDFHHLNSSQALCFNLFGPFMMENRLELLQEVLGLTPFLVHTPPHDWGFERVFDSLEGTNFDFFIESDNGVRLLFELKYSERHFGDTQDDEKHRKKLADIYRQRLEGKVASGFLEGQQFFANYQILRNLSYLGNGSHVFFVVPRANESLARGLEVISNSPTVEYRSNVHLIYLEDLLARIQGCALPDRMISHFKEFSEKYINFAS